MKNLILASASPRRKMLLEQIGLEPEVIVGHADEQTEEREPEKLVQELARRKCRTVADYLTEKADIRRESYVLGADTIVVHRGAVLGKPKTHAEAERMLASLQGDTHQVYTGVCLLHIEKGTTVPVWDDRHCRRFAVYTDVRVNVMTEEEIHAYVNTEEPMDKAGAYGIQGQFARHIGGIRGDYTNVVGLPVAAVYEALRELHFYSQPHPDMVSQDHIR